MQKDAIQIRPRSRRPVRVTKQARLEPMGDNLREQPISVRHGQGQTVGLLHDPVMGVFPDGNHPALHPVGTQGVPCPGLEAAVPDGEAARPSRKVKNLGGCGQHDGPDASQAQSQTHLGRELAFLQGKSSNYHNAPGWPSMFSRSESLTSRPRQSRDRPCFSRRKSHVWNRHDRTHCGAGDHPDHLWSQ